MSTTKDYAEKTKQNNAIHVALDKKGYLVKVKSNFYMKIYVVGTRWKCLSEALLFEYYNMF